VDKPVGRGGGKRLIQALGDNFRGKRNQGSGATRHLKVIPRAALVTGHWGEEVERPGDRQGTALGREKGVAHSGANSCNAGTRLEVNSGECSFYFMTEGGC